MGPAIVAAAAGVLIAGALLFTAACANPEQALYFTVEAYLAAIQQRNDDGIAHLWGPFRRETMGLPPDDLKKRLEAFRGHIVQAHRTFEQAKLSGELPPEPLGVAMFRGLGLGKGAVSLPVSTHVEPDGRTANVRTKIVTNLETLHLDSLPDGVRIYLMGFPLGRLETISVGFEKPSDHHLLHSVEISWTLSRAPEGAMTPTGWLVESLAADPSSAVEWTPGAER